MAFTDYQATPQGTGSVGALGSDPQTQALIGLAQSRGGAVSQAVNELVHPQTSILSTIGDGFKKAFKGFVDTISIPSNIVAGAISSDYTIQEAMDLHIKPSDVIFGDADPSASTLQKVGSFVVRTATDVLLDPLTYVTFGADSVPLFGAKTLGKVTLQDGSVGALNKLGTESLDYLTKVERQQKGLSSALALGGEEAAKNLPERLKTFKEIKALEASGKIPQEVIDMSNEELSTLLKQTVDAPLDTDFAKKALSNILANNPALTETLLDKGGIKFFGQTVLSGQRIHSVTHMIPGMTALDEVTQQTRYAIGGLFDPAIQKGADGLYVRMPPEFVDFQRKASDMAEYLKDERIGNIQNIIKGNNLDANEGKFLMAAVEAGKLPADARLANAYKQLMGFNEQELNFLRSSGIAVSRLDNHAPHVLVSSGIKVQPFKMPISTKVGAAIQREMTGPIFNIDSQGFGKFEEAVLSKNQKMVDEVVSGLKRDGFEIFDDNFVTASVNRSLDNVRAGTSKQFIDSLARNFAATADKAPQGWVGLNLKSFKSEDEFLMKMGMENSQLRFHPAVAKRIEEFTSGLYGDASTQDFLKAYDRLQNLWKGSVTSIFPAFHGRNALGNVFLNFNDIGLEALNPATHAMSAQVMHLDFKVNELQKIIAKGGQAAAKATDDLHDVLMTPAFTDRTGMQWTFGELQKVIKQNNIALSRNLVGQVDNAKTAEELVSNLFPDTFSNSIKNIPKKGIPGAINPLSRNFKPYEIGSAVGSTIEGQARLVNFLTNLKNTGDVGLATARTKQFLFDYKYLTSFEKNVLKRIIPFYSFTKKNLEAQVHTLMTAPGRTAAQLTALTNLGDAMSGAQLSPEQEAALPDWIKSGINILKSKNGNNVEVLGSLGTPIEAPFQQFQPNQALASVSPLIRLPVELASGYDFYQGKPLSETTNAAAFKNAPSAIKDFIGYTDVSFVNKQGKKVEYAVALRPGRMHVLLNLPPTSRVLSAMKQMDSEDVSGQSKILQQLVGVRPYAFDLEQEQAKQERELQTKIQNLLSDAGVGYQFNRFVVPKATTLNQ